MDDILRQINRILSKHLDKNKYKFFLYGSRAKWDFFFRSDYDIWVLGDSKVDLKIKYKIEDDFENIPALIDFTDFASVSDDFKELAMKDVLRLNK